MNSIAQALREKLLNNKKTATPTADDTTKAQEIPSEKTQNSESGFFPISNPNPQKKNPGGLFEILPIRVNRFDELLEDGGIERGMTVLISGGAGTGKTTFCMQSIYYGALKGEKGVYISFEEEPDNIRYHMKKNFGWNLEELEKKGLVAIIKFDPTKIARQVEEVLVKEAGMLRIKVKEMVLPIKPDRIAVDSLSALAIEFENEKSYRKYIKELFHTLQDYNSINLVISETEQNPRTYSRTGVEEFLGDGVIVLYNLKVAGIRKNALEILKLRSGKHVKEMVPYALTEKGFEIFFRERTI
ncbi:MAG: ATPase domain-containing protein [Candidatus Micrarchaeota archaeon]